MLNNISSWIASNFQVISWGVLGATFIWFLKPNKKGKGD